MNSKCRFPTHVSGNTLDLITKYSSSLVSNCSQAELISDHYAITFNVDFIKPVRPKKLITYRKLSQIDLNNFMSDICLNFYSRFVHTSK